MDEAQPAETDPPEAVLRRHANRLNRRRWRWPLLCPQYHLLADALYWEDGIPPWWMLWGLGELENALRLLWHFRTGLMLGESRPGEELWQLGKELFPRWVGFHPSRCQFNRRHVVQYRVAHIASIRCIDKWFNELDADPGVNADGNNA